jgi:hypothetical protein
MVHSDAGHYAAKHPGKTIDTAIADRIGMREKNGRIGCAAAHDIAQECGCTPMQVGTNIDLLEKRISNCQLGLFGHGGANGKAVEPSTIVPPPVKNAILSSVKSDRITCIAAWAVARQLDLPRLEVGCACESMSIKVVDCQLGAF